MSLLLLLLLLCFAVSTSSTELTEQDTIAPVLTVSADQTLEATSPLGAIVTFTATATDAVTSPVEVVCTTSPVLNLFSGSYFPVGVTTVICNAKDAANNNATPKSFTITVKDTTTPSLTVPISRSYEAEKGVVVFFDVVATDAVTSPPILTCTSSPVAKLSSGSIFGVGVTTINCTAADKAGNQVSKSFTISVTEPCHWTLSNGACKDVCIHWGCGYSVPGIECIPKMARSRTCICPEGTTLRGREDNARSLTTDNQFFIGCDSEDESTIDEILEAINSNPDPIEYVQFGLEMELLSINKNGNSFKIAVGESLSSSQLENVLNSIAQLFDVPVEALTVSADSTQDSVYDFILDEELSAANAVTISFFGLTVVTLLRMF